VCDLETSRIGAPYIYIYDISNLRVNDLTLILLKWRKWWANNASKEQMGFNSGFKGLMCRLSWNRGDSTSWNPHDLSRPVMGFLYLFYYFQNNFVFQIFADLTHLFIFWQEQPVDEVWNICEIARVGENCSSGSNIRRSAIFFHHRYDAGWTLNWIRVSGTFGRQIKARTTARRHTWIRLLLN